MTEESPFQPGVRVAIVSYDRWTRDKAYRESRVLKVHKTGRFTLEIDPGQQWRPFHDRGFMEPRWRADATGGHPWNGERLYVWDAAMDEEVASEAARQALLQRWRAVQERIKRIRLWDATAALVEAVEAAIVAFDTPEAPTSPGPDRRGENEGGARR